MNVVELAAVAIPFVVSPGASFVLTLEAAVAGDRRAPLGVWIGTALGISIIALIAGLSGLGDIIMRDHVMRVVLRLVGGSILIFFGAASLFKVRKPPSDTGLQTPEPGRHRQRRVHEGLTIRAFLIVITNVKALSLYLLIVPTITHGGITGLPLYVAFAATHIVLLFVWLALISCLVFAVPVIARTPVIQVGLRAFAGLALIILGAKSMLDVLP